VRLKLQDFAYKATVIDDTEKYLSCEPEQCAANLRSSCLGVSGLLLGGTIYRDKPLRTRSWLYRQHHRPAGRPCAAAGLC